MADSVQFAVELVDKVTGPAKKATAGIKQVQNATVRLNKAGRLVDSVTGRFVKLGEGMGNAGQAAKGFSGGIVAMFKSLAAIGFVAGIAQRALGVLQQGLVALGRAVIGAFASAESLQFSLSRFLGSGPRAAQALKRVHEVANKLGLDFQQAATNFKNFISAGFTEIEAENLLRFKADVLALGDGSEATAQRIEEAFLQVEKAMATGRIEADQFNSILANLPVTKVQVLEKLAAKTGQSVEELAKMDVTKLPVKELMESFQEATLAATGFGKLGDAAVKKVFSTVSGAAGYIKTRFVNVLDDLAAKVGPGIGQKLMPVLERLIGFLQSPAFEDFISKIADGIVGALDSAIDSVIEFVDSFQEGDFGLIQDLAEAFMTVHNAVNFVGGAVGFLKSAFDSTQPSTSTVIALLRLLATAWLAVANIIITVVGGIADVIGAGFDFVVGKIAWLIEAVTGIDVTQGASNLAAGIINGIAAGIQAGADAVVQALSDVVDSAVSAVKSKLKIGSPSKLFEGFGRMVGLGFAGGIDAEAPTVAAASAGMVAPRGGGASAPANVSATVNQDITVNEAQSAAATAKEVRRQQAQGFAELFERMSLEMGTA